MGCPGVGSVRPEELTPRLPLKVCRNIIRLFFKRDCLNESVWGEVYEHVERLGLSIFHTLAVSIYFCLSLGLS